MRTLVTLLLACLCGCGETENNAYPFNPVETSEQSTAEYELSGSTTPNAPAAPVRPSHNYDAKDGLSYSYIGALSENDIKAGRAAGDVFTFVYLGERGDKHVLARVLSTGRVLGEIYCTNPCRIISYPDGSQIAFNEGSVIGAAFADAIAGRLQVASYQQAPQVVAATSQPTSAPSQSRAQNWSEVEAGMILRWMDANEKCRGSSDAAITADACANRDEIHGPALAAAGICYGRQNEPASSSVMHRCERGSNSLDW